MAATPSPVKATARLRVLGSAPQPRNACKARLASAAECPPVPASLPMLITRIYTACRCSISSSAERVQRGGLGLPTQFGSRLRLLLCCCPGQEFRFQIADRPPGSIRNRQIPTVGDRVWHWCSWYWRARPSARAGLFLGHCPRFQRGIDTASASDPVPQMHILNLCVSGLCSHAHPPQLCCSSKLRLPSRPALLYAPMHPATRSPRILSRI